MSLRTSRWCMDALFKGSQVSLLPFLTLSVRSIVRSSYINEGVHEEVVKLFYANLQTPEVSKGTKPILKSHLLGYTIEFSLSTLCEILDLPNEGDHVFFTGHNKLHAYGKIESDVFSPISFDGEKVTTPKTRVLCHFQVVYWKCCASRRSPRLSPSSSKPCSCMFSSLIGRLVGLCYLRVNACHPH